MIVVVVAIYRSCMHDKAIVKVFVRYNWNGEKKGEIIPCIE